MYGRRDIFFTGRWRGDPREQQPPLAHSCGVANVLTKPCEPDAVLATVEAALGLEGPAALAPSAAGLVSRLDGSETILVVEDEEGVRKFAKTILQGHGYQVLEARN